MHRPRHLTATLSLCAAALLAACGGGDGPAQLKLELTGLANLGPTAMYEGWLIVGGKPVSTGRFSVDDSGKLSATSFEISRGDADNAGTFVLTVEQTGVPGPAAAHLVAGDFDTQRTMATVSIAHTAALGTPLTSAGGSFILATPSSASTTDDNQGIWFLSMASGSPAASLSLPTLATGWVYEGWVVVNGMPRSTGRFTRADMADSDGAGSAAGPLGTPPFPGQDFITPALVLSGGMAVISIEPEKDNSPAPFLLKPLQGAIGSAVGGANNHPLTNTTATGLPGGKVRIER